MKRSLVIFVQHLKDILPGRVEHAHHLDVTVVSCDVHWSDAVLHLGKNVGVVQQQRLYDDVIAFSAVLTGQVEWGAAFVVFRRD